VFRVGVVPPGRHWVGAFPGLEVSKCSRTLAAQLIACGMWVHFGSSFAGPLEGHFRLTSRRSALSMAPSKGISGSTHIVSPRVTVSEFAWKRRRTTVDIQKFSATRTSRPGCERITEPGHRVSSFRQSPLGDKMVMETGLEPLVLAASTQYWATGYVPPPRPPRRAFPTEDRNPSAADRG